MVDNYFVNRCLRETLSGLRDGLSLFSGKSRTAIIFSLQQDDELYICDPQNLLRGYEPKLQSIYIDDDSWKEQCKHHRSLSSYSHIESHPNLQLDGLISYGGSSEPVCYQMWFTEHLPNICSPRPTECWLEHAVLRFSHDMANDSTLYTGISGSFLREYGKHAVHDCVVDMSETVLGLDIKLEIDTILDVILAISKTSEEGKRPHGALTFVRSRHIDKVPFISRFHNINKPLVTNFKHVRKLLQAVEDSNRTLISDGHAIVGIAENMLDIFFIAADFQGKFGFLNVNNDVICSFEDGNYSSNTHRAKLFEVEEALLDFDMEISTRNDMFQIIASLVHNAEDEMFGCTFVIDVAEQTTTISGQELDPPINLMQPTELALAAALSKVDGALQIRADLHLHAFACLLDGHRVENEDRARGARYNSALRFTAQHPETIVVVVSSDRPVSIFRQGAEILNKFSDAESYQCNLFPVPLQEWLDSAK